MYDVCGISSNECISSCYLNARSVQFMPEGVHAPCLHLVDCMDPEGVCREYGNNIFVYIYE